MRRGNLSAFLAGYWLSVNTQYKENICFCDQQSHVWNISLLCIWGSSWQRWEEVYVLSEDAHQDLWTQCIWHQTEAGVDYRSACIMICRFDNLSGVLFVNCRESLEMFISLSSFPFFKRQLVHQDTFLYFTIGHCCCVTFKHFFFNNASLSLWFGNAFVSENLWHFEGWLFTHWVFSETF